MAKNAAASTKEKGEKRFGTLSRDRFRARPCTSNANRTGSSSHSEPGREDQWDDKAGQGRCDEPPCRSSIGLRHRGTVHPGSVRVKSASRRTLGAQLPVPALAEHVHLSRTERARPRPYSRPCPHR